jgi:hypothetical protein
MSISGAFAWSRDYDPVPPLWLRFAGRPPFNEIPSPALGVPAKEACLDLSPDNGALIQQQLPFVSGHIPPRTATRCSCTPAFEERTNHPREWYSLYLLVHAAPDQVVQRQPQLYNFKLRHRGPLAKNVNSSDQPCRSGLVS